jgi:uncharacterized protein YjiS (DUF1127 family)
MTFTLTTRMPSVLQRALPEISASRPLAWFRTAVDRFEERRQRDAAEAVLQGLDSRTLRDIGVDRSEITSLVYGGDTDTTRINRR